ncbi:MAG: amino acid ABC transporter substrate-binding protein [Snowella sp.]|nr:amino acid ABC transporter substrate-binding protein [Snowella sp.]
MLLSCLALILLSTGAAKASAETVLEKVAKTGVLNAGTRVDTIPFGYLNEQGKVEGYSVDLSTLIQKKLEKKLNKPIKLNLVNVNVNSRFKEVESGNLDLVCSATTITQERLERVNFSIPFFVTGAQFLVKRADEKLFNINGTLKNLAIAYLPNTTTSEIIPQIYPAAKWVAVQTRQEGIAKLKKGEVNSVVSDGILLIGELVKEGQDPRHFALMPKQPITTELYGCILPKQDTQWKEFVDAVIASPENHDLQNDWFNVEKSKFPYLAERTVR